MIRLSFASSCFAVPLEGECLFVLAQGLGFKVLGFGFRVFGLFFRVEGSGSRLQGVWFMVYGLGSVV